MTEHHLQFLPFDTVTEIPQWNKFIVRYPKEHEAASLVSQQSREPIELVGMKWRVVTAAQREVNLNPYQKEPPGRDEWKLLQSVNDTGDCEDIALTKRSLLRQSIPVGVLRPVICKALIKRRTVENHMVLSVHTTAGDYIMDLGRSRAIRLASFYPHQWLWMLDDGVWRGLMPHTQGYKGAIKHSPTGLHDRLSRRRSRPLLS